MKYLAIVNGKRYEIELERLDLATPLDRGERARAAAAAVPALPVQAQPAAVVPAPAPVAAPVPAAAPAPAPAPAPAQAPAAEPAAAPAQGGEKVVEAPMPGKVLKVLCSAGQAVKSGDAVVVLEAMKMETEIVAQDDGTVAEIHVHEGDSVDTSAKLVTLR